MFWKFVGDTCHVTCRNACDDLHCHCQDTDPLHVCAIPGIAVPSSCSFIIWNNHIIYSLQISHIPAWYGVFIPTSKVSKDTTFRLISSPSIHFSIWSNVLILFSEFFYFIYIYIYIYDVKMNNQFLILHLGQ